jgi:O-antigen ligase
MAGLFILQIFYPQFRKIYLVSVFIAVIVLWATWDRVNQSAVVESRLNNENVETYGGRDERWKAGFRMWQERPIRGWGSEGYAIHSGRFRQDGISRNFKAIENDFLFILVSSGLIGFLPYLIFLLAPFLDSWRLFFRARAPDWSGFIKQETIAVYWCVVISYAMTSYTQVQNEAIVKMIPFALAGAVVGTHQHWLKNLKPQKPSADRLPVTAGVEMG